MILFVPLHCQNETTTFPHDTDKIVLTDRQTNKHFPLIRNVSKCGTL